MIKSQSILIPKDTKTNKKKELDKKQGIADVQSNQEHLTKGQQ